MANIGFIGLGIMGAPMAKHLIQGGHTLFLHSRSGVPNKFIEMGSHACSSPKAVAHHSDFVIMMLPDTPDVEKVLFGEEGITEALSEDNQLEKIIIDMSSISPIQTKEFAHKIENLGSHYVDAPVSGGDIGAQNATLTIMVGATQDIFTKAKPLFELMGTNVTHIGDIGAGQTCKIANQIIVALTIEAVGEALLFSSKAGVDPKKVQQALMGGFAASKVLEIHGSRMINRNFDPGFRIELQQKDLDIAITSAAKLGVSLPNTATAHELFNSCIAHNGAKWDNSAIVKALEILSNHEISKVDP